MLLDIGKFIKMTKTLIFWILVDFGSWKFQPRLKSTHLLDGNFKNEKISNIWLGNDNYVTFVKSIPLKQPRTVFRIFDLHLRQIHILNKWKIIKRLKKTRYLAKYRYFCNFHLINFSFSKCAQRVWVFYLSLIK